MKGFRRVKLGEGEIKIVIKPSIAELSAVDKDGRVYWGDNNNTDKLTIKL
jgi:hypothetical protein